MKKSDTLAGKLCKANLQAPVVRAFATPMVGTIKSNRESIGRNDPCPCGSGRKFKKCCVNVQTKGRS